MCLSLIKNKLDPNYSIADKEEIKFLTKKMKISR